MLRTAAAIDPTTHGGDAGGENARTTVDVSFCEKLFARVGLMGIFASLFDVLVLVSPQPTCLDDNGIASQQARIHLLGLEKAGHQKTREVF